MKKFVNGVFCSRTFSLALIICMSLMLICLTSIPGCKDNKANSKLIMNLGDVWSRVSVKAEGVVGCISRKGGGSSREVILRMENFRKYLIREINRSKQKWGREIEIVEKSVQAMSAISAYLHEVVRFLADFAFEDSIVRQSAIIESGTRARESYEDVIRSLDKRLPRISGEFFECGLILLADRFSLSNVELSPEVERIINTVVSFMNADIKEFNPDVIWSLLAKKIHEVYAIFGVSKEEFASKWLSARVKSRPVDFAISGLQTQIDESGKALVPVVVYVEKGSPLVDKVGLVLEGGSWKIERYPFAGLLGTDKSPFGEPVQD